MTNLQQQQSSHGRRAPVHRGWVIVCSVLLLVACGPSSTSTNGTGGSSSGDETSEGGDEILWAFGGGDRPVLSWPVTDDDGNIFVLVGVDAAPDPEVGGSPRDHLLFQHYAATRIDLVSLASDGRVRWEVPVATPDHPTPRELRWRPAVGPGGDVWVCHGEATANSAVSQIKGDLSRISNAGELLWTTQGACLSVPLAYAYPDQVHRHALSSDGTYYLLAFVPTGDPADGYWRQEFRAIGPDGVERWRRIIGLESEMCCSGDFTGVPPTEVDAPLVLPDGVPVSGCNTCQDDTGGLARFDPSTGAPAMVFAEQGGRYGIRLWDGDRLWMSLGEGPIAVNLDGEVVAQDGWAVLAADSGLVLAPETSKEGVTFAWGSETFLVSWEDLGTQWVSGAALSAVVDPDALVVTTSPGGQALPCEHDCGLALVSRQGEVTWRREGVFGGTVVPAIGDGFIAYIEDDGQRLVAVKAPVTGVADGPWPIIGGNPQATRSAE